MLTQRPARAYIISAGKQFLSFLHAFLSFLTMGRRPHGWAQWTLAILWAPLLALLVLDRLSNTPTRSLLWLILATVVLKLFKVSLRATVMYLILSIMFLQICGIYDPRADVAYLAAILFGLAIGFRELLASNRPSLRAASVAIVLTIWWILSSALDRYLPKSVVRIDPHRFDHLPAKQQFPNVRLAFALSGGGYRAALMHAGVLSAAEQLGLRPRFISSVSGGSIFAAYYATGGDPTEFPIDVGSGCFSIRRNITHIQNLIRFARRSDIQADMLDATILGGMSLAQLNGSGPPLLICTTDLKSGYAYGWGPNFVVARAPLDPEEKHPFSVGLPQLPAFATSDYEPYVPGFNQTIRASKIVGSSGAFPLAFNPIPIQLQFQTNDQPGSLDLLLSDGGLSDNTGLDLLLDAHRESLGAIPSMARRGKEWPRLKGWDVDYVIASDASAVFQPFIVGNSLVDFSRAMDIVSQNEKARDLVPFTRLPKIHILSADERVSRRPGADSSFEKSASYAMRNALSFSLLRVGADWLPFEILVGNLPEQDTDPNLLRYLDQLKNQIPELNQKLTSTALRDTCKQLLGEVKKHGPHASAAETALDGLLLFDSERCLDLFAVTSTLQDTVALEDAQKVYRLGSYLLIFDWPEIKTELDTADVEYRDGERVWEMLASAATRIAGDGFVAPEYWLDSSMSDLLLESLRWNGPIPHVSDVPEDIFNRDVDFEAVSRAEDAAMAHRLAHAILNYRNPDVPFHERESIIDEIRNGVQVDADIEAQADDLTVAILKEARVPSDGLRQLFERSIIRFGTDNVNPGLEARIRRLEPSTKPAATNPS